MNPVEEAVATYPELQRLVDLKSAGWMFRLVGTAGQLDEVMGMRMWKGERATWADFIQIRSATECVAVRCNPLKERVWQHDGDLKDTVDKLMELPHPEAPNAPRLVLGPAVHPGPLWTQSGTG